MKNDADNPAHSDQRDPVSRNDLTYALSLLIDWDRLITLYRENIDDSISNDDLVVLLKMYFIGSYLKLSISHTPMIISDSITLRNICGAGIDAKLPDIRNFSRFYNLLDTRDIIQLLIAEINRMISVHTSRVNDIRQTFLPVLAAGEVAGWLFEHLGNVGNCALTEDFIKLDDDAQSVSDGAHSITGYHVICCYTKQADYENKLYELQMQESAHKAALHNKEELERIAANLTKDDKSSKKRNSYAKYILALSCWVSHGSVNSALNVYGEDYAKDYGSIAKSTMYKIIDVYLRGGLPALRNLENSDQSLKAGFPIAWENFYFGQIMFHKPTVALINDILSVILERHPYTSLEVSEIRTLLRHAFSAFYIDAPHPEYDHEH
ncbi:MAG: transposase [Rhodospirillaceae bacterium]